MDLLSLLIAVPILCLSANLFIPSRFANLKSRTMRNVVTRIVGIEFLVALLNMIAMLASRGSWVSVFRFGFYIDGAASLMLVLVSFVGYIVSRFSIRYLDGEATQGRYFRWLGFTIGAVSLMVVSGNLLLFFASWVMTSFGLHQLLLHYRHREAAHRAAWTKFTISRLGDAFLIGALVLTYKTFGTFQLPELFERAKDLAMVNEVSTNHIWIGWLLVLGAVTKSAQFPFHTWLPNTMETPTPVSALMHAGIVNAGGYLIIRMSPIVALAPTALTTLAIIGAFTACFAGVVMMTQPTVKRALAYSTIAQMGFMMLQCGLGAFSAAMLHILAHSLYKAHAFLSSGSVISQAAGIAGAKSPSPNSRLNVVYLISAAFATALAFSATSAAFGFDSSQKAGGIVLAFTFCLALTTWGWRVLTLGERNATLAVIASLVVLCGTYFGAYAFVHNMLEHSVAAIAISMTSQITVVAIGLFFSFLFALHTLLAQHKTYEWLEAIRIHALNGFYVETFYQRLFASVTRS